MWEAPKIIFIGEIRDRETMEIVLNAGETGRLVMCTLHTTSAAMTVNRIFGMFGSDEENQVRERLAGSMRYIISQRLVPVISGSRLLVTEMMGSNLRTREAILLGESEGRQFNDIIESSNHYGCHTFEQSLIKGYEQNLITNETALLYCSNRMKMIQLIDTLALKGPLKNDSPADILANLRMQGEDKKYRPHAKPSSHSRGGAHVLRGASHFLGGSRQAWDECALAGCRMND